MYQRERRNTPKQLSETERAEFSLRARAEQKRKRFITRL